LPKLLVTNGATFSGLIERMGEEVRASYLVKLEIGATTKTQKDVRMFPDDARAEAWLHYEAASRGFRKIEIVRK
jgi:hypothetical protein